MASNPASSYGTSALKHTGPSISMVDNAGSMAMGIGNYKGVMLCNRPFGGTAAKSAPGGLGKGDNSATFSCGVVSEPAGLNVPISLKEKMVKRPNKDSVLAKHKKWLADLQKTKDRLEMELLEEARKKEETQLKFQEHEKKMRLAARSALHSSGNGSEAKEATRDFKDSSAAECKERDSTFGPTHTSSDEEKAQPKSEGSASSWAKATAGGGGGGGGGAKHVQAKPAWAMTEQAAEGQDEELQRGEEEDLLDFARGLDFDRYIGDVEVQAVMERLRKRITDLEKEVALEDMRHADAETRAALRAKLEQMGVTEASLQLEAGGQSGEGAALAAARALLQEEEDMQAVHSAKSVAALLKTAKEKIAQVKAAVNPPPAPSGEPRVMNEPLIVVHEPNEGSRLEVKNALSKLPYMNRNPAV